MLIFVLLGMAVLGHWRAGFGVAWPFYTGASLLVLVHLFLGDVWVAFRHIRHQRFTEAQRLLDRTLWPGLLVRRNRAYYYLSQGVLALHRQDRTLAEGHLRQALDLGLTHSNDRAIAKLNLAHLAFVRKDFVRSQEWTKAAKAEQPTDLLVKQELERLSTHFSAN